MHCQVGLVMCVVWAVLEVQLLDCYCHAGACEITYGMANCIPEA